MGTDEEPIYFIPQYGNGIAQQFLTRKPFYSRIQCVSIASGRGRKNSPGQVRCLHNQEMVYQAGDRIEKKMPGLRQMGNSCKESFIDVKLLQKTNINEQQTK